MKSLSPNRPLIIMMVGIPGAGKSQFASQFSDVFRAPVVSADEVRGLLFSNPEFSKDEDTLISKVIQSQITQLLKTQKTFIVDGLLNTRMSRAELERLARANEYGTLVVWVQTDEVSAKYRATRKSSAKSLVPHARIDETLFENYSKRINPPQSRENHVVISGKHTFASQAKAVLKKLVHPRDVVDDKAQRSNIEISNVTHGTGRRSQIIS